MTDHAELTRVPQHVAIIMDGNGRWAEARGLPRAAGHRAGTENLRRVLRATVEFGVPILTIYAFSTENWSRPSTEVRALMMLLEHVLDREVQDLHESGIQIRHIGRKEGLSSRIVAKIAQAERLTRDNERLVLNVAFNYGGRAEIVDAVKAIIAEGIPADDVDEDIISEHLATAGLPDPDLVIRTGGDMRLSNYLIWQAAYAEFYSTPIYWPDFDKEQLFEALASYSSRERRFGGLIQERK
jgi:undecaprenyl diphosphate synthase